jgi:uncharacterized protein YqeY
MTLKEIQNDMIAAMRAGDKFKKGVLAELVGAIKKAAIDEGCRDNIPEELVDKVLLKEKKTADEMICSCPQDRADTLEEYKNRFAIVNFYAPTILSDEKELKDIIVAVMEKNELDNAKSNRGKIMKILSTEYKGKIDMKVAASVLGSLLV